MFARVFTRDIDYSFLVMSLSGLGINAILASLNELGSFPHIFGKNL